MTNLTLTREDRAAGLVLLNETREYITRGWVQGVIACDRYGEKVNPSSGYAVCWCLEGGLLAAAGLRYPDQLDSEETRPAWVAEMALEQAVGPTVTVTEANDGAMSVEEVFGWIDVACTWLTEGTT